MTTLELRQVRKRFGMAEVIRGVDLKVEDRELCVFVGPSGCGKSTLLRMIAGLEDVSDGEIRIDGEVVNALEPSARRLAMVFQSYALYPHMSVEGNMSFGLRMTGTPREEARRRVAEAASILQLTPLMRRKPAQLSGGQRQRVAIGRAIVRDPKAFLFDEPLSNLDAELRVQMRVEIARLHKNLGSTTIYVTHDQVEAMTLADKIVVLRAGVVEQVGSPADLYERPVNRFVAGFIGSPRMNFLEAAVDPAGTSATIAGIGDIPMRLRRRPGEVVTVGMRPGEFIEGGDGPVRLSLTADVVENLGGSVIVHARTSAGGEISVELRNTKVHTGESFAIGLQPSKAHFFDAEGDRLTGE